MPALNSLHIKNEQLCLVNKINIYRFFITCTRAVNADTQIHVKSKGERGGKGEKGSTEVGEWEEKETR